MGRHGICAHTLYLPGRAQAPGQCPEHYDYREEEFPPSPPSMEFRSSRPDQQGFIVQANLNKAVEAGAQTYGCLTSW